MGKADKRPSKLTSRRDRAASKRPKNLSLDAEALRRGEEYSRRHQTNLSRLVGDFLRSLPLEGTHRELSPAVQRLRGVAAGGRTDPDHYREHLLRKYGGR